MHQRRCIGRAVSCEDPSSMRDPTMPLLHDRLDLRGLACPNRIFMAPLTRQRASGTEGVVGQLQADHYAQRATFGLIISEATQISSEAKGYPNTPGLYSDAQIAGWKLVTDRVHAAGGRIFVQLWHVGRVSHVAYQPDGQPPVAPVAIRSNSFVVLRHDDGRRERVPASMPRALRTEEMPRLIEDFAHSVRCAKAAGFDGVEVHAANSYLINQFLSGSLNDRADEWGGSIENRMRLLLSFVDAAGEVFSPARVGVRLSPMGSVNELAAHHDDEECMRRVATELGKRKLAYLHLYHHHWGKEGWSGRFHEDLCREMRTRFDGPIVLNGYGTDVAGAQRDLDHGLGDAVAFGKLAISNPDLPARLAHGTPLAHWDDSTFYGDDARGYNDYPAAAPLP